MTYRPLRLILPALTAAAALSSCVIPVPMPVPLPEPDRPRPPEVGNPFVSDRFTVTVKGTGRDVILIPGLSSSPNVWESTIKAVPGYRYHLVHVNGFGGKAPGGNASGPFLEPVAHDIARYIEAYQLKAPVLVGHSLGGTLAMRVAGHHPDLVGKLMVVDMLPFMGQMFGGPAATPESVKPVAEQIRIGITSATGDAQRKTAEQTIAGMVKTPSMRSAAVADTLASDPAVSGQAMYDLITTDLRPELARYKGPMEVLWVYPPNAPVPEPLYKQFFVQSYKTAPQAVVKKVPDAWHFLMWDNPAMWQAELKAFLEK